MSTQLRLLTKTDHPARPLRGRVNGKRRSANRPVVHWEGQWRLDERTRQIGRAGVASAREALARTHADDTAPADGDITDTALLRAS